MRYLVTVTLLTLLAFCLCTPQLHVSINNDEDPIAKEVRAAMDLTVDPCDDFYKFTCGAWIANTTLPDDIGRYVKSFDAIAKKNRDTLVQILSDPSKLDPKLTDFYQSCMDEKTIDSKDATQQLATFNHYIDQNIDGATSWDSTFFFTGMIHRLKMNALFSYGVEIDAKEPSKYLYQLSQGGLQLPDRSFYLGSESQALLDQYKTHISKMFTLLKIPGDNDKRAAQVIEVEKLIAQISSTNADLRDPFKTYNKISTADLMKLSPNVLWARYLQSAQVNVVNVNVKVPSFFKAFSDLLAPIGPVTTSHMANYLRWVVLHEVVDYLPALFRHENFNFFGKIVDGSKAERARVDICIDSTDESIGFLLSQYYVAKVFPGESKQKAKALIEDIETSVKNILSDAPWMQQVTKDKALIKLSLFTEMIGYPDNWPKYDGLRIKVNDYFENKIQSRYFSYNNTISKLPNPVDHGEWEMTPETVNAYYEPTLNDIVFPAAILQAPFFNKDYPLSMNLGAIGMVMSHECYHGFDDQGRLYDGHGKLENWWTPQDAAAFEQRAACLVNQYNKFSPLPGYFVNGNLTLGENIADGAGMKNAYATYIRLAGPDAQKESILKGFTNAQLFFIAYGQLWCTKARDEVIKQRLLTDPHSPGFARVIGPLQNLQGFADTFKCAVGSKMNPANKCVLF